ncbi:hypothetical protein SLE2022_021140 [Rubroshorea leprosula]
MVYGGSRFKLYLQTPILSLTPLVFYCFCKTGFGSTPALQTLDEPESVFSDSFQSSCDPLMGMASQSSFLLFLNSILF